MIGVRNFEEEWSGVSGKDRDACKPFLEIPHRELSPASTPATRLISGGHFTV
jgi:hypothetical protein